MCALVGEVGAKSSELDISAGVQEMYLVSESFPAPEGQRPSPGWGQALPLLECGRHITP